MKKTAIVLASFGASRPNSLRGITNIEKRVRAAYPGCEHVLAFTSNMLRRVWQKRAADAAWRQAHPEVPGRFYEVQGVLAAVANLQDRGLRDIIVQPMHVYAGEEYLDLKSYVESLGSIRTTKAKWMPFNRLALGRPALGAPGPEHPYLQDLRRAADALAADAELSRELGAPLVYVGHGNEFFSTGVYHELERILRSTYPGVGFHIGTVEGFADAGQVLERVLHSRARKVLMRPLMIVAGEHAQEDICGHGEESWRSLFQQAGVEVECALSGLGEMDAWADIYVHNIADAAHAAGLEL